MRGKGGTTMRRSMNDTEGRERGRMSIISMVMKEREYFLSLGGHGYDFR